MRFRRRRHFSPRAAKREQTSRRRRRRLRFNWLERWTRRRRRRPAKLKTKRATPSARYDYSPASEFMACAASRRKRLLPPAHRPRRLCASLAASAREQLIYMRLLAVPFRVAQATPTPPPRGDAPSSDGSKEAPLFLETPGRPTLIVSSLEVASGARRHLFAGSTCRPPTLIGLGRLAQTYCVAAHVKPPHRLTAPATTWIVNGAQVATFGAAPADANDLPPSAPLPFTFRIE